MTYQNLTLFFAFLMGAASVLFSFGCARWPGLHKRLPRERVIGSVLASICLVWAVFLVLPMLEGGMLRYRTLLKLLVPGIAVLAYFFLDYLFTRALGGFLLLCLNAMIYQAFVVNLPLPFRTVYDLLCYGIGIGGLLLIGMPWVFRDLLEKAETARLWRMRLGVVFGGLALFFLVSAFVK